MTIEQDEFVPFDYFARLVRGWWIAVLCALIGGGAGFLIHRAQPPIYEAQAVLTASIDVNKIDFMHPPANTPAPYQFTQYDEDIALAVVNTALNQVAPQVAAFAQQNGIQIDSSGVLGAATIEREHAYWKVRFRNPDPVLAQKVVNYWAQQAFSQLKTLSSLGQVAPYVTFDLVSLADVPKSPAYYQTNSFVMAGGLLGLIAGLLAVNLPFFNKKKDR